MREFCRAVKSSLASTDLARRWSQRVEPYKKVQWLKEIPRDKWGYPPAYFGVMPIQLVGLIVLQVFIPHQSALVWSVFLVSIIAYCDVAFGLVFDEVILPATVLLLLIPAFSPPKFYNFWAVLAMAAGGSVSLLVVATVAHIRSARAYGETENELGNAESGHSKTAAFGGGDLFLVMFVGTLSALLLAYQLPIGFSTGGFGSLLLLALVGLVAAFCSMSLGLVINFAASSVMCLSMTKEEKRAAPLPFAPPVLAATYLMSPLTAAYFA